MNITLELPETLLPAGYNPRKITEKQLHDLAESILTYGFVEPVILNDATGLIVGGHRRVKAVPLALKLAKQRLRDGVISEDTPRRSKSGRKNCNPSLLPTST